MKTMTHRQYQHVGSFFLLFLLLTWRPESLVAVDTYVHLSAKILAVYAILAIKIHWTVGYTEYWRRHKVLLFLLVGYHLVVLISLIYNLDRYESIAQWLVQGWGFVAIQSTLIAGLLLFTLPRNTRALRWSVSEYRYAPVLLLLIVALCLGVAVWNYIDYKSAHQLKQYFVAGYFLSSRARSVFAINTDWGSIAALALAACLLIAAKNDKTIRQRFVLVVIAAGFLWAGFISNSANFFLTTAVCVAGFVFVWWRLSLSLKLLSISSLVILFFAFALHASDRLAVKIGALFSPVLAINRGECFYWSGFFGEADWPRFLNGRDYFLESAYSLWVDSPWLGVSNGGLRLAEANVQPIERSFNTHNLFVQIPIDAGLIGVVVAIILAVHLYVHYIKYLPLFQKQSILIFVAAVLATLTVDYFPDHALSWNIVVAYLVGLVAMPIANRSVADAESVSAVQGDDRRRLQLLIGVSVFAASLVYLMAVLLLYYRSVPHCFSA